MKKFFIKAFLIKKNIEKSRLADGAQTFCEDSISFLKRYKGEPFDIVFLDPPYATKLIDDALKLLFDRKLLKPTSYIVCESDRFEILGVENSQNYDIIKTMKHGIAHVSVLKLKNKETV